MGKVFGYTKKDYLKVVLNGGLKKHDAKHLKQLAAYELQLLIANGNPSECNVAPDWRRIPN
jgi:hypothetical protein